jgi:hypothetical protein
MKKHYILASLVLASAGFFAFQQATTTNGVVEKFRKEHFQTSGGQSGLTGAPGESNCTQCHSGAVQSGSTENQFSLVNGSFQPVTEYTPGATYTATLQLASSPDKGGFSSTTLDGSNVKAGTLVGAGIGGTQNFSAGGRDYVSHTATSSTAGTLFAWSWVAPATGVGDVTFYIASNVTNNNGANSGDMIYLSQHVISEAGAGISETSVDNNFAAGYNVSENKLDIKFDYLAVGEMSVNLVDMNGRSVFTYKLGESEVGQNHETIALPSSIEEGMYVVHFFVGNKAMSANILVKK